MSAIEELRGQALAKYQQLLITAEREIGIISQWELRKVGQKENPLFLRLWVDEGSLVARF